MTSALELLEEPVAEPSTAKCFSDVVTHFEFLANLETDSTEVPLRERNSHARGVHGRAFQESDGQGEDDGGERF